MRSPFLLRQEEGMRIAAFGEDACVGAKIFDQMVPIDGLSETIVCEIGESGYSPPLTAA